MKRPDGRKYDELRPVEIITGYQSFAEGSALIKLGKTHVLCSVSVEERVPPFLKGERHRLDYRRVRHVAAGDSYPESA